MKRKSNILNYTILLLAVIILIHIFCIRVIDMRFHGKCPIPYDTVQISEDEADAFFKNWADYVSRGYNYQVKENSLYYDQEISKQLPWIVRLWFEKRCISADRFYYVEQRMRNIIRTHDLKDHADGVADILKSEMAEGVSNSKSRWYKNVIDEQYQLADVEKITSAELKMIEGHEETIRKILE